MTQSTPAFLDWVADRMVNQYGESDDADFVQRLRAEARRSRMLRKALRTNHATYELVDRGSSTRGRRMYRLFSRGTTDSVGGVLHLTQQQAADLNRQLDAPIDYYNGPD